MRKEKKVKTPKPKRKDKKQKKTQTLEERVEVDVASSHYQKGFIDTLLDSKAMKVFRANQNLSQTRNASMLDKAKVKQGIISAATMNLQHSGNILIFEIQQPQHVATVLEVIDDLKDRYTITHGYSEAPQDKQELVISVRLKEVDLFG